MSQIQGITFDNQQVNAKNDGTLYSHILTDGVISGCAITFNGQSLFVASGYFIASGRVCKINQTTIETQSLYANGYGQIILRIDLSKPATEQTFEQATFDIKYLDTTNFPALTQEKINNDTQETVYETQVCIVKFSDYSIAEITENTVISIVAKAGEATDPNAMPKSGGTFTGEVIFANGTKASEKTSAITAWKNASLSSAFPPQTISFDIGAKDLVLIRFKHGTTNRLTLEPAIVGVNEEGIVQCCGYSGAYVEILLRKFNVLPTGITFQDGWQYIPTGNNINNSRVIPIEIILLKGARNV